LTNTPEKPDLLAELRVALADRYEIGDEVGAGGMSTVYRARDLRHDREVALKVLRHELASALGADRFLREIRIAAQLQHPHILPLYDSGEAAGMLFYVMPLVKGESLRAKIARDGALAVPEAVRILRDVADALAYAHDQGVVHRDIKPDNVMLSGRHALVTDFGVAKAVSSSADGTKMTTVGVALGTPAYMAPEQAMAEPDVDQRADVYATGILAYEMLTGAPPFAGQSAQQVLSAQVLEPPTPISDRRAGLPPELAQVIMRCLAKERTERWSGAQEILPRLDVLATPSGGMTPTHTRPLPATAKAGAGGRRRVLAGTAAALVIGAVAIGAWLFGSSARAAAGPARIERLAVLPLRNLASDQSQDNFLAQLHTQITAELTLLGDFRVTPAAAVAPYRLTTKHIPEIARELDVDGVIDAAVLKTDRRLRMTVSLVEGQSDHRLWTESYDYDLAATPDAGAALATAVAQALKSRIAP